jgi:hypothetical protein
MIVKTDNPIIYSNAFGDGSLKAKFKGLINKQKGEGGLLDKAKGLIGGLGKGGQPEQTQATQTTQTTQTLPPKPKGMSKKLKIGLIVGGSVLVLTIIAIVVIKSKSSK